MLSAMLGLACGSDGNSEPGSADAAVDDAASGDASIDGGPTGAVYVVTTVERLSEDPLGCAPDATGEGNLIHIAITETTVTFSNAARTSQCARDGAEFDCLPDDYVYTWEENTQTTNWDSHGELGDATLIGFTDASYECTGPGCESVATNRGIIFPCLVTTKRTYTPQ